MKSDIAIIDFQNKKKHKNKTEKVHVAVNIGPSLWEYKVKIPYQEVHI